MSHTKQPLQLAGGGLIYRLSAPEGGHNIDEINVTMWGGSRTPESRSEGAKLVRACMDACIGIPADWLQSGMPGCLKNVMDERNSLLEQRDELIETTTADQLEIYALKRQRDELLDAAGEIEINAEECLDFDECTAVLVPIDDYHKLIEAIARVKGGAA